MENVSITVRYLTSEYDSQNPKQAMEYRVHGSIFHTERYEKSFSNRSELQSFLSCLQVHKHPPVFTELMPKRKSGSSPVFVKVKDESGKVLFERKVEKFYSVFYLECDTVVCFTVRRMFSFERASQLGFSIFGYRDKFFSAIEIPDFEEQKSFLMCDSDDEFVRVFLYKYLRKYRHLFPNFLQFLLY